MKYSERERGKELVACVIAIDFSSLPLPLCFGELNE